MLFTHSEPDRHGRSERWTPFCCDQLGGWVGCCLYAVDVALSPHRFGFHGDKQLRSALEAADKWARTWNMRFSSKKSQVVQFSRLSPAALSLLRSISGFGLGASALRIVPSYPYLGLIYDSRWSWRPQFASLLVRASRLSYLISRVVTPTSSVTVRSIRSLVLGMLLPLITYAAPFWRLLLPHRAKLNALLARPLARALRLPASVHHLSLLIECAVPDIHTEWEKQTLCFASRCFNKRRSHPSNRLIRAPLNWTVPAYSLVPTAIAIAARWGLRWDYIPFYTSLKFARASHTVQEARWRAADKCSDLLALRLIDKPDPRQLPARVPARYLLHDDRLTASYRARLRLNRSFLNDSQFRRHISGVVSAACSCGAPIENARHLLFCPLYRSVRTEIASAIPLRFLLRPSAFSPSATDVLLGECISLYLSAPDPNHVDHRRHYLYGHRRPPPPAAGESRPPRAVRCGHPPTTTRVIRESLETTGSYLRSIAQIRPGSL